MPGIATKFEILGLVIAELKKPAAGAPLHAIAQKMEDHIQMARLGVIGPALADFLPSEPPGPGEPMPETYAGVWKTLFTFVGGEQGLFATLKDLREIVDKLQNIADKEDWDALQKLQDDGEDQQIKEKADNFMAMIQGIQDEAKNIAEMIGNGLRPNVDTKSPGDPVPGPETWTIRDLIHWKKTGQFAKTLIDKATGDEQLAYAYGWLVGYTAHVCASPFLNSAAGGPSRTQWSRQRFVRNYVDAWVHGFYQTGASMMGDDPTPPYASWPDLCEANLQDQLIDPGKHPLDPLDLMTWIKVRKPLPTDVLPPGFGKYWVECFTAVYGPPPPGGGITPDGLNGACVLTWLVLWFMTSGDVVGCNLVEPMQPPDNCGDSPQELDPFQKDPETGNPTPPPDANPNGDVDGLSAVCGIFFAVVGVIISLMGGGFAGLSTFVGGVAGVNSAKDALWPKWRCQLFWLRKYIFNGLTGLHKLLAISGFGYPDAEELGEDPITMTLLGVEHSWKAGKSLTMSQPGNPFPSKPWDGSILTFNSPPEVAGTGFETPQTIAYRAAAYPSFFVNDDIANPLSNGDVKTQGNHFPDREEASPVGALVPTQFGNVVANVLDLFKNLNKPLPNWNLDGDRGLAYLTWQFKDHYDPDNIIIEPET